MLTVRPGCRVILDNDWSGDPDGLLALAHHVLSPANRVVAVTSSFLEPRFGSPQSAPSHGSALVRDLLRVIDPALADELPVHDGAPAALADGTADEAEPGPVSAAAEAIVAEASHADDLPLFVACGGPLTNVAQALRQVPSIAERFELLWIGGTLAPGAPEYNRDTDPVAAREVLATAGLRIRQFPQETYRRCAFSLAELELDLGTAGPIGAWLWNRFCTVPLPAEVRLGGQWPLGDSPPVLVTALDDASSTKVAGPKVADGSADLTVYTDVDTRLLFADMLARFRLHGRSGRPGPA